MFYIEACNHQNREGRFHSYCEGFGLKRESTREQAKAPARPTCRSVVSVATHRGFQAGGVAATSGPRSGPGLDALRVGEPEGEGAGVEGEVC
jgi:hypothetical protein